jgi:diadenosine tetraphosphate (Ap4A) HIT family hydrolase
VGEAVEGLAVDHAHIHVLPIESGFEREFAKPKSDENSEEDLRLMAERLRF